MNVRFLSVEEYLNLIERFYQQITLDKEGINLLSEKIGIEINIPETVEEYYDYKMYNKYGFLLCKNKFNRKIINFNIDEVYKKIKECYYFDEIVEQTKERVIQKYNLLKTFKQFLNILKNIQTVAKELKEFNYLKSGDTLYFPYEFIRYKAINRIHIISETLGIPEKTFIDFVVNKPLYIISSQGVLSSIGSVMYYVKKGEKLDVEFLKAKEEEVFSHLVANKASPFVYPDLFILYFDKFFNSKQISSFYKKVGVDYLVLEHDPYKLFMNWDYDWLKELELTDKDMIKLFADGLTFKGEPEYPFDDKFGFTFREIPYPLIKALIKENRHIHGQKFDTRATSDPYVVENVDRFLFKKMDKEIFYSEVMANSKSLDLRLKAYEKSGKLFDLLWGLQKGKKALEDFSTSKDTGDILRKVFDYLKEKKSESEKIEFLDRFNSAVVILAEHTSPETLIEIMNDMEEKLLARFYSSLPVAIRNRLVPLLSKEKIQAIINNCPNPKVIAPLLYRIGKGKKLVL